MCNRSILFTVLLLFQQSLFAASDLSGVWMLDGRVVEGNLSMTEEALRIQQRYDLLVDDPSLSCVPASTSRVWANPNVLIAFEQMDDRVLISYEFFDLRREIPIGDIDDLSGLPSTQNVSGDRFAQMGSSMARYEGERLVIESRNHSSGYIRTSRGVPQSEYTTTVEEIWREGDVLHLKLTYFDESLFTEPFVLIHTFAKVDEASIPIYACTDADYGWFEKLNMPDNGESE